MRAPLIAVLDYGIGNLHSAQKAFEHLGADSRLTTDAGLVGDADGVVLPGVGAFGRCMEALRESGLEEVAHHAVASGRPFLGICVGMQMLFDRSDESPGARGLGVVPGAVQWLPAGVKRPQMQWNRLSIERPSRLFDGLGEQPWMYFVHSFHPVPDDPDVVIATTDYGGAMVAAVEHDNVAAVQFHPEKSSTGGLALLANWASALVPA
jgi:glutamine amidotransferase